MSRTWGFFIFGAFLTRLWGLEGNQRTLFKAVRTLHTGHSVMSNCRIVRGKFGKMRECFLMNLLKLSQCYGFDDNFVTIGSNWVQLLHFLAFWGWTLEQPGRVEKSCGWAARIFVQEKCRTYPVLICTQFLRSVEMKSLQLWFWCALNFCDQGKKFGHLRSWDAKI